MQGNRVAITGIGETAYLRKGTQTLTEMIVEASLKAIADAGLKPEDVDGFVGNANNPKSDDIGYLIGMKDRSFSATTDVLGGTAAGGQALLIAQLAIEAGLAKHVLVPYGIWSNKPGGVYAFHANEPQKAAFEMPVGYFGQVSYFAIMANRYAYDYGLTEEELAAVSITFREWAVMNPRAQKRDPMGLAEYRQSPMMSTPLRVADCCLTTDGGAAYVVSAVEQARDLPHPVVQVQGIGVGTSQMPHGILFSQKACTYDFPAEKSAKKAFAMAGCDPKDLNLAQVYDGFSISALVQTEMLGLCERGKGGKFYAAGHCKPGGRMPVNTSGGHMSGGYVPGIALINEAVRQLRGQEGARQVPDAKLCGVAGLGGNSHSTVILARS